MAKSGQKKAKKQDEWKNRLESAGLALGGILLGQPVGSLVKPSLDKEAVRSAAEELDPKAEPLREGMEKVKTAANDLTPDLAGVFGNFKNKIQKALEKLADSSENFDRAALLGLMDRAGDPIEGVSPRTERKTGKKKQKKPK